MRRFCEWLVRRFAPGYDEPTNQLARSRVGLLEGWISIVVNIVLAALKAVLAVLSGSVSLMADAVHTFADSGTSVIVIIGFRLSRKPADEEHPYGHGRFENLASLVIGILLAVAAFELGRSAVERLLDPQPVLAPTWVIVLVAITAVAKEVMARFSFELGRLIGSDALEADGWHHRSDVFATALVVVAFVAARFGLSWFDGVAGIGVAVLIAWAAWHIIDRAAHPLIGAPPSDEEVRRVVEITESEEGVLGTHDVILQRFGARMLITLHVVVPRDATALEAHHICQRVERRLTGELGAYVTTHADPEGSGHPLAQILDPALRGEVASVPECADIHDLRVEDLAGGAVRISFDVGTFVELAEAKEEEIRQRLVAVVHAQRPDAQVEVDFDPPFARQ